MCLERLLISMLVMVLAGCRGGDALVEMSAADALDVVSVQTRRALDEYHADLGAADDAREAAVIAAFVQRARRDGADDAKMASHAQDFAAALAKMRGDRQTAWERHARASENVEHVDEIAQGLRRLAMQSISLSDEWNRYIGNWIEAHRRAQSPVAAAPSSTA